MNLKKAKTAWLILATAAALCASADMVQYYDPINPDNSHMEANCTSYTNQTTLTSGWYVVEGNVNVNHSITVNGDVNLILKDNAELKANWGITVDVNNNFTNSLTIDIGH